MWISNVAISLYYDVNLIYENVMKLLLFDKSM